MTDHWCEECGGFPAFVPRPVVRLSSGPGARSVSVDHHWVAAFEDSATAHAWAVAHAAKIGGTLADD